MISEYEHEPVRGLPCKLAPDEQMLWQGSPQWKTLAVHLCHVRVVTAYFAILMVWCVAAAAADGRTAAQTMSALAWLSALTGIAIGLLCAFAYLCARTTIYTITTRRVALRYGIAFTKAVNVPLRLITGAGLRTYADGSGDIPLQLSGPDKIAYLILWPHARPWRFAKPEPMLRAIPEAERVAIILRDCLSGFDAAQSQLQSQAASEAASAAKTTAAGAASVSAAIAA